MVDYKLLGYNSVEEYLADFRKTLLKSAHGYDFFVDWKKVEENAKRYLIELGLLNSLTLTKNSLECKMLLKRMLKEHPRIISVIPILLAVREKSVEVAEVTEQVIIKRYNFETKHLVEEEIDDMISFCEKTGIIDLFGKIKDVYTYVFGVEVGLDTNARKNRAGAVFNKMIEHLIDKITEKFRKENIPLTYKREVELGKIGISYPGQKTVDFLIFYKDKPLAAFEVNIYHGTGSKPNEIVRSYIRLHMILKNSGILFFWLTDGPGWVKMWNQFREGVENIDYIMNYTISERRLEKILVHTIKSKQYPKK
ncbi:MAG: type II restriction endonuclease [Nitrososphaeria archaeon]|nr:type II restriction endonuclease [Nitrososphaeria archaeon]